MTYREVYELGRGRLEKQEIADADLDARLLLEYSCKTNRTTLLAHPDREVSEEEYENYVNYIERREQHIPLQHITGEQEFMGLEFYVNQNVLVPRQDTEILVEEVMRHLHDGMDLLDMCTGSGCILCSLLHYSNDCHGLGVDVSPKALEVARQNAQNLGITAEWTESNLFSVVQGRFDIIVSNPPYIRSDVIPTLMPEVKAHEPMMALDGKEDGLFFYREIIKQAGAYLRRSGMLFFEIGFDQAEAVSDLMREQGFAEVEVKKDYAGLDRVVYGTFRG